MGFFGSTDNLSSALNPDFRKRRRFRTVLAAWKVCVLVEMQNIQEYVTGLEGRCQFLSEWVLWRFLEFWCKRIHPFWVVHFALFEPFCSVHAIRAAYIESMRNTLAIVFYFSYGFFNFLENVIETEVSRIIFLSFAWLTLLLPRKCNQISFNRIKLQFGNPSRMLANDSNPSGYCIPLIF